MSITLLEKIKSDAIKGIPASVDDCIRLAGCVPLNNGEFLDAEAQRNLDAICDAADEVRLPWRGIPSTHVRLSTAVRGVAPRIASGVRRRLPTIQGAVNMISSMNRSILTWSTATVPGV